ncbi:major facilitator superfamily domain-containing protein [Macrophomina phaseolina]|uniref:Major facilitator superfamily domain-containing protein n=1 Tax=Macrophomina phaseolina TaxID=35725 RepID=A0ABQ8FSN4_9PEZI|nr:major facilitator superfamily domain-containing protein [Macrophomina phaseolina]
MAGRPLGEGMVRSESERTEYAPDGLHSNTSLTTDRVASSNPREGPQATQPDQGSFESPTPVNRSSMDEKDPEKDEDVSRARRSPLRPTASDESDSADDDIERQKTREQQRPAEGQQEKDPNIIEWDGPNDPENPMNWANWWKWTVTITLGLMTFTITFASSVFSTATMATSQKFGVSSEVMILGTSLFVLGFAFGPIMWGPLSELYGRKYPLFFGFFVFAIFQIPVAVAQNLQTIMLARFFGGLFGSAPLAIVGGALADFWDPIDRGIAVCIFAGATFIGPVAGPIVGGFTVMNASLGWRWTEYFTAIMAFFFGAVGLIVVPETYAPVLLQRRAKKVRYETRNWAIHSKHDENQVDFKSVVQKYLARPFAMLVLEPILLLVTIYMAVVYGILYLFFESYPIAFQEKRGWNEGVGALPFLSITVGVVLGGSLIAWTTKTRFKRKLEKHGKVIPEERLIPMIIGGFLFPVGMFWFAWTSSPNISPWPQICSGVFIGAGILMIFLQGLNYIIDVYMMNANSAIAANTLLRSLAGAGFPLFAVAMYHTLGVSWATSLLAFIAVALFPVPILFYIYGAKIRKLSKYSPSR